MNASTIFVVTFALWLVAKGRMGDYAELVTTKNSANSGDRIPDTATTTNGMNNVPTVTLPNTPKLQSWRSNSADIFGGSK